MTDILNHKALKKTLTAGFVSIFLVGMFYIVFNSLIISSYSAIKNGDRIEIYDRKIISFDTVEVSARVADTFALRQKGLSGMIYRPDSVHGFDYKSGISEFGSYDAMLFSFEQDGNHSFWMKDMEFPIDIVWVSHDGVIVHIEQNVHPATFPQTFSSDTFARHVIELRSGFVREYNIKTDDVIKGFN